MAPTASRVLLLLLLALGLGCGGPSEAPGSGSSAALPDPGASWVAGHREAPQGGRLIVGLLLEQRDPKRLADLIPPEKLRAWLEASRPEEEEVVEWEEVYVRSVQRTWGQRADRLQEVATQLAAQRGIEVVFREVLADEVAALPLVLVGTRRLHAAERRHLATYRERGGRLVQLGREVLPAAPVNDAQAVRRALDGAIADSPFVHVLPRDPFAVQAAREGDDIVLTMPVAGTAVTLQDAGGQTVATATASSDGRWRLRAPDPELDPFAHHVVVRWAGDGVACERARSVADLVGTVETTVEAGDQVHAGGAMALRIRAHLVDAPVAGRRGRAEIVREGVVLASTDYVTDGHGYAYPRLDLPAETSPGTATLRCEGLAHALAITSGLRLSVVTDRPLYKQTDKVHVRLMAHRAGDGRPVAGQDVVLSLGEAKRTVTTSEHGIASHAFELVDAGVGGAALVAEAEGATARCAFRVKAFERPTFTVQAEPGALELRPEEHAPLVLTARYVNGTPFVGGKLVVEAEHVGLGALPTAFDAQGRAEVVVQAQRRPRGRVYIAVQDAEGRRVEVVVPVTVRKDGPRLDLRRISDLAVGVPARFEVTSSEPGVVRLEGDFEGPKEIAVPDAGRAEVTLTPLQAACEVRLAPTRGSVRTWQFHADTAAGEDVLVMALDRRGACVGETLGIELRSPKAALVHLDVWKDATPVLTLSRTIGKGSGRVDLPLDASMAGVLQICAHFAEGSGRGPRATVLVTRGRALQVAAATRAERHAPGGTAEVDVTVRDAQGRPTAAVLGYWGVDEALLALAPATTGHERVFDVATLTAQAEVLDLAESVDRRVPVEADALADLFLDRSKGASTSRAFPVRMERTPQLVAAAEHGRTRRFDEHLQGLRTAYEAAWKDLPVTELVRLDSTRETLQWLMRVGRLDGARLRDPWGTPLGLWSDRRNLEIHWTSAGPDRTFGTDDDLLRTWDGVDLYWLLPEETRAFHAYVRAHLDPARVEDEVVESEMEELIEEVLEELERADNDMPFEESFGATEGLGAVFEGPATNSAIGIGGGAGGRFFGRGGRRDLGTGGGGTRRAPPLPYVRKDFDPTLCFVPEAIVGPDGTARLEIPLKDAITTWRLRLVASAADGAVGVGAGSIRVRQAVHAAPWMASHLTVGDLVDVPVAVRNEEPHAVTARVFLAASDHLVPLSAAEVVVSVAPGATARAVFRLQAARIGTARVRLGVETGGARDDQERVVTVHPHARAVVAAVSGSISADAAFPTAMATAGPGEVRLDLYPSPLAEVLSGFDGLIAAPHG